MRHFSPIDLGEDHLGQLMPMHILFDEGGVIAGCGPTIRKMLGQDPVGATMGTYFHGATAGGPRQSWRQMRKRTGETIRVHMVSQPDMRMKAVLAPWQGDALCLANLSFGISVLHAVQLFDLTAADFAPTDLTIELLYLHEANRAVRGEFRRLRDRLERSRNHAEEEANTDKLTGLANRRFLEKVVPELAAARRGFALIHLDLDYFKQVNDTHGHDAGDLVLQETARRLRAVTRADDIIARTGGDEFVLVIEGLTDPARLTRLCETIIAELERPVELEAATCRISGSAGFTVAPTDGVMDLRGIAKQADEALYAAKAAGRGRVVAHGQE